MSTCRARVLPPRVPLLTRIHAPVEWHRVWFYPIGGATKSASWIYMEPDIWGLGRGRKAQPVGVFCSLEEPDKSARTLDSEHGERKQLPESDVSLVDIMSRGANSYIWKLSASWRHSCERAKRFLCLAWYFLYLFWSRWSGLRYLSLSLKVSSHGWGLVLRDLQSVFFVATIIVLRTRTWLCQSMEEQAWFSSQIGTTWQIACHFISWFFFYVS
jgi:hypothetical protein